MVYMITYDLCSPGQNYDKVDQAIQNASSGKWIKFCESAYLIKSYLSADQIVAQIKSNFDKNDRLLVAEITKNYQGLLTSDDWKYIRESLF